MMFLILFLIYFALFHFPQTPAVTAFAIFQPRPDLI